MSGLCDMLKTDLEQYYMPSAKGVSNDKKLSKCDMKDILDILKHNNRYSDMDDDKLATGEETICLEGL